MAYEVERAREPDFAGALSSGCVTCHRPFDAPLPGEPLRSREVCWCRVRVWTESGESGWSDPLRLEAALLDQEDWLARPVSPDFNVGRTEPAPVCMLRRAFQLDKSVAQARLYLTALGIYRFWINGRLVDNALLEPGWSAYEERLLYATYDVTEFLQRGENVLAAEIADGWWRGHLTWHKMRAVYGETTALLAQAEIQYIDGTHMTVATDDGWRGAESEIRFADIYDGYTANYGADPCGWREPGFDDTGWSAVRILGLLRGLEQRTMPPVRVIERFDAEVQQSTEGAWRVDCRQNLAGFLRLEGKAERQGAITVRHAEVLEPEGALHTAALRGAKATEVYEVGPRRFVLEPQFTYHGFRYADVAGDAGMALDRVTANVVSSDLRQIGRFACSDERINQLWSNIIWSQIGNFVSIPTDCSQRDERLGWTGDIQVFAPTACANFDCRSFLSNWLVDLGHEQAADGRVPSTVPNVISFHEYAFGGVGWADAAILVPWALYEAYGDRQALDRQFPSMCAWVEWGLSRLDADGVWTGDFHLGDWLDPGAPPDRPEEATTPRDFVASAYLSRSASILGKAAQILGRGELAARFSLQSENLAAATWRKWSKAALATQTGCALAIEFGIAPPDERLFVGGVLAAHVEDTRGRIGTGFLGTPLILPALTRTGQIKAAYRLLLNEEAPGWLYQVGQGATTMWERWDAVRSDGTIHGGVMAIEDSDSMVSFNHYAYGSVGAWLYRSLAGMAPRADEPGYGLIDFAPQPGGGLEWAEVTIETPYGEAGIRWELAACRNELRVALRIPPGARATFASPKGWSNVGPDSGWLFESGKHVLRLPPA